jgi:glycosyltransferase involved in cell wall biosynthesis
MIEFIAAVYNEEQEIRDLIIHVYGYVNRLNIVDDVSTDNTVNILHQMQESLDKLNWHQMEKHTGLCELVRIEALDYCNDDSWIIMLDADERFADGVLRKIVDFIYSPASEAVTHIYFSQKEMIDGQGIAEFAKVKVFRKSYANLPEIIHREPTFGGEPTSGKEIDGEDWVVWHRKSSNKQVMREIEYLQTYEKLYQEGKVTKSDVDWFIGMHHYVKPRG